MAYHNLLSKVDQSLVAYLISGGAGTEEDVFTFKRAGDLPNPPYTTVFAESGMETVQHSGGYMVKASVDVHTNAAPDVNSDTEQMKLDSDARVSATFDLLHTTGDQAGVELAEAITAAATSAGVTDFTVDEIRIIPPGVEQGRGQKEGEWIDTINLELTCRPS